MTCIDYFIEYWKTNYFPGTLASNSEIRRWFKNKAIVINDKTPNWDEEVEFSVWQLVLHPKSKKRTTLI